MPLAPEPLCAASRLGRRLLLAPAAQIWVLAISRGSPLLGEKRGTAPTPPLCMNSCWGLNGYVGHAGGCQVSRSTPGRCTGLPGIVWERARHCTGLPGIARCCWALHGAVGHCTVLSGVARCRWATCGSEPGIAWRCRALHSATGHCRGRERAMPGAARLALPSTSPVPVPTPAARRSPAAGSAGFAVSGALFSAREALAQQMAGITKQLAAAKPIIYLIMIYHLTT